ncbi:MAG: hypothetical protein GF398_03785 [Chitinivibrionales bacterium]|nr:hypothetical protein [Chitinivibrionales bacterium]
MKCIPIFLVTAWLVIPASGRDFSIEEVLDSATRKADEIKIADLSNYAGHEEIKFYRSEALPNIMFSSSAMALSSPYSALTSGGGGLDGSSFGMAKSTASTQGAPTGQPVTMSYPDRIEAYTLSWGVTLQQALVTFGRVPSALRIAKEREVMLGTMHRLNYDLFYLSLIQAYSAAYLNQKNVEVSAKSLEQSRQLEKFMALEVKGGAGSQRDYLRTQSLVLANRAALDQNKSALNTSIMKLFDLAEIGRPDSVNLTMDEGHTIHAVPGESSDSVSLEYKLKQNEARLLDLNVSYERGKLTPSLYLTGGINNQQYMVDRSNPVAPLIGGGEAMDRGEMLENFMARADQISYSIGLALSWTIFDGRRSTSSYRIARANAGKAQYELQKLREQNTAQIKEARDMIRVLDENLKAIEMQLEVAQKVHTATQDDFKAGHATLTDVIDTEKELASAEKTLHGLKVQKIMAITQLKIALGLPLYK